MMRDSRHAGAPTATSRFPIAPLSQPLLPALRRSLCSTRWSPRPSNVISRVRSSIAGAGVLAGDRLGCMNITLAAHAKCLRHVAAFGKPLLVLGGGGSGQSVAARAWCAATAALCEVDLPEMVPDHDYTYYHGAADPPFDLASVTMDNGNSEASLTRTREACLRPSLSCRA